MVRLKAPARAQLREQPKDTQSGGVTALGLRSVLAYAANTDELIHWDQLAARMSICPPVLSEREHVQRMLDLANGLTVSGKDWNQLVGAIVMFGADESPVELQHKVRQGLVANFELVVSGSDVDCRALAADAARVASNHVVIVPSWTPDGARVDRMMGRSMYGALAYGVLLVLDPQRPFRDALCRCHYSGCRKFFLARSGQKAGAPNRSYCSKPHARRGDTEKARLRMQRLRGTAK